MFPATLALKFSVNSNMGRPRGLLAGMTCHQPKKLLFTHWFMKQP
jgi:hypothetical protein